MELTNEQQQILRLNGWRQTLGRSYKCHVCHHLCGHFSECWISPNFGHYHLHCVSKSAQVKRLLARSGAPMLPGLEG